MEIKRRSKLLRNIFITAAALLLVFIVISNIPAVLKLVYPLKYKEYVYKYSAEYNIDPYLVFSIMKAESSFNTGAVSRKDARGLMQITKSTGQWAANKIGIDAYTFESLHNPETNIRIGCWYLNWLRAYFQNESNSDNTDLVIAAYNSGSGSVSGWLKDKSLSSTGYTLEKIPYRETSRFLKRVKNNISMYKRLYES